MTRKELETLKLALVDLDKANNLLCKARLRRLELDAEREHAVEDAHHDAEESKDRPVNVEAA
jgi:hypothetical protein